MRVRRVEEVGTDGEVREVYDRTAPDPSDWPNPEAIQSELPPVQSFSEELVPAPFRPLVRDVAERMQVPMDYPAVVTVLCLAGAVNRRAIIQPKANDSGWVVVPNLWGGIIAPPGFMKSPVIQHAIRPLSQIQSEWRLEHKEAQEDHTRAREEYELRVAAWKEQYKSNSKHGRSLPERPNDSPEGPKLRPEAQELFVEWLKELEEKVRRDELHPALISHLSKYRKLMPALSLLFEMAAQAAGNSEAETVSLVHTRLAAAWCDYLESHARRVYSCIVTPQLRSARELADKIKKRKVGANGIFTCRDVYLKAWSGLDTPDAVKMAAEVLEDAHWVRDVSVAPGPLGGRPSNRYAVNPGVWA
jgi:hypothetical protein